MAHGTDRPEGRPLVLAGYVVLTPVAALVFGLDPVLGVLAGALNVVFGVYFCRHLAFAVAAARWAERDLLAADVGLDTYTPPVAVLVGCKNEELVVDSMVAALLALDYPPDRLTLVVVDDGSEDATGAKLDAWAAREPRLRVLHRPPGSGGGKSGALNDALALVEAEVVLVFDADHEPESSALRRLVRHFRDPVVGAVMGRCVIRNGRDSHMAGTVFVDYLSGYLVNEYGRQALFELPAYGGANCAVRMSTLRALGGWNPETVTEDTDLTLRILAAGQRVRYDVSAIDFEEAVVSAQRFWKQRYRWARGHQKCLRDYWWPLMRTPHLSPLEKVETSLFLAVYHVPMLSGLGLLLTVLRAFGIGDLPLVGLLPLSMLLFIGPLAELCVGLLVGRVERRSAWRLLGFLPAFALSIWITSRAYVDGMLGRPYTWVKTTRSGAVSTVDPAPAATDPMAPTTATRPRSFAAAAVAAAGPGRPGERP
ncbi:Glycosyltransferase, catalytic subunit of cellulose synthase and poly-beta-1,6-N-acetylglucosamine synthase [Geodermatophilus telluris]|uniref:Glycosyltransferase, catalytic subunit of cellulose synthase and poly-beta-1,6-N-acetylglucosamine synthase n=1 Tax=Geodermatophilus telluris TaxID=1190417 RepID=A0A1G6LK76_9ACTN|nr:glycosyltransferase family 2 protein [Geodermatophilus telluris]SDC43623.1 Glycosyltransferase, catalytic subunit of cellulose synthase and poly-beta-1,6-N-acetylglucosamine synthase [Geodermatophilus telluris]